MDHSGCTPLHHACINAPDGHRSVKVHVSQSRECFVCKMPFHGYFMWMSFISVPYSWEYDVTRDIDTA